MIHQNQILPSKPQTPSPLSLLPNCKPILASKPKHISRITMSAPGALFSLAFLFFFAFGINHTEPTSITHANVSVTEMVPVMESGKTEMMMMMNESRRRLGSFRICALCTCCGGAKGVCLPSPCCYAINCNIPNRPFGFCSFTPKTCNCFGCHI